MSLNGNGRPFNKPELPGPDEFEYVHALLSMIAEDENLILSLDLGEDDLTIILASRNILCWILGHSNTTFPDGLRELEDMMRTLGEGTANVH